MRRCLEQLQSRSRFRRSWVSSSSLAPLHDRFYNWIVISKSPLQVRLTNPPQRSVSSRQDRRQDASHALARRPPQGARTEERGKPRAPNEKHADSAHSQHLPEYWVGLLERFLPRHLSQSSRPEFQNIIPGELNSQEVLRIVSEARTHTGVNILGLMVLDQHRYKAVIHLVDILLKAVALAANQPFQEDLPSNISWPSASFAALSRKPIELDHASHVNRRSPGHRQVDLFDNAASAKDPDTTMELIWSFLADLVIASTKKLPDEAKPIMSTVHQILALVHNLSLVPDNIYNYDLPKAPTTLRHPPILHLLISRILSTLSDAVWRAYQDEALSRAGSEGPDYWSFFQDAPGSRFRLKVRELGPEVWLEFILWCCLEAGFAPTAARILKLLQEVSGEPWRAIHWTAGQSIDDRVPPIDWKRANTHSVSTASQREGYSFEKPLAEMPERTISAEVVLAIADGVINNVDVGTDGSGLPIDEVQTQVKDVLSFLEPHGLAPSYFDYLTVRFLQTECLSESPNVYAFHKWAYTIAQLRNMEAAVEQPRRTPGLSLDSVLDRSALEAGILHQTLQACIESNLVARAVETFTDIQKLVDGNKLEAIGEFLSRPVLPQDGFFTSRPSKVRKEFISSYGQLPTYKASSFLNMVTDAELLGLGDWLLFSKDIDGAILPSSTWGSTSVAVAVIRYATVKKDPSLIHSIFSIRKNSQKKPTVNFLRALAVFYIRTFDWHGAIRCLGYLQRSEGGGYSPNIVASLTATILRLERDRTVSPEADSNSDLPQAISLLAEILRGHYDRAGSFRTLQKKVFRQQVGYLLRLLENVPDSSVAEIAHQFKGDFPLSNEAKLAPNTFNIVFAAIIETKGAWEGRSIWRLFCKDPRADHLSPDIGERVVSEDNLRDGESQEYLHSYSSALEEFDLPNDGNASSPGSNLDQIPRVAPPSWKRGSPFPNDNETGYLSSELPLEGDVNVAATMGQMDSRIAEDTGSELNPIVVPNMRTLQILVQGALTEKELRQQQRHLQQADLDELLHWAQSFYGAFHLREEDIASEFRIPNFLPEGFVLPRTYPRIALQERSKLNLGKNFTRAGYSVRQPGGQGISGKRATRGNWQKPR